MISCLGRIQLSIVIFSLFWIVILNFYVYSIKNGIRISRPLYKNVSVMKYEVYSNRGTTKNLNISLTVNSTDHMTTLQKMKLKKTDAKRLLNRVEKNIYQQNGIHVWAKQMKSKDLIWRLQNTRRNQQVLNKYNVNFKGKINQDLSPQELLCQLKLRVNLTTMMSSDLPASAKSWSQYLPTKKLEEVVSRMGRCAVVISAGSMKFSKLGPEIDSHDAVLRFNSAPTDGFQTDVGSKTTFRVLNSQVVTLPEYKFLDNPIYKEGILLMWDPVPYLADIQKSYKPEFQFFDHYIKYRNQNPQQPFYILNPKSSWQLWNIIQENAPEFIQPNPPSSGSLGILLMMNLCDEVNVYEFLPSFRMTDRCYYYKTLFDRACTYGAYHPLIYEKNLIKKLNLGEESSIFKYGKITLPSIRDLQC